MSAGAVTRRGVAIVLTAAMAASGCATSRGSRVAAPDAKADAQSSAVFADFVQRMPLGTTLRVDRTDGRSVRGTLIKATGQLFVLQPKTRIPEPPLEIPFTTVLRVAPESSSGGSNVGKFIGAGLAAGAGAVLGIWLIALAIYGD